MTEAQELIASVFFPHDMRREQHIREKKRRFVHYTNAETAFKIISSKRIWMRNVITMNDYSEVQYGIACLENCRSNGLMARFNAALDHCHSGISNKLHSDYNLSIPNLKFDTYLTCLSEHLDDEDAFGRLSMWRAYGGDNGVALVLRPDFLENPPTINVFSSPVLYASQNKFCENFLEVITNIENNAGLVSQLSMSDVLMLASRALQYATLCTKHPGFHEEREWRAIYTPASGISPIVERAVEAVRGVPQVVNKIVLSNRPDLGTIGLDAGEILDRVIIGPTRHPMTLYQTFFDALQNAGIQDPAARISLSDIPLRT